MDKFSQLVNTIAKLATFKAKYSIPNDVEIKPCEDGEIAENKGHGRVVFPLVAFVEDGVRILMSDLLTNYLKHFKLCPDQCAPIIFWVVSCVDELNKRLDLNLTHHDINCIYNCWTSHKSC